MVKKGTSASPAMARARRVLPVPGAPLRRTPFGILPPNFVNFLGSLRKAMISSSSAFASSIPATFSKVTRWWSLVRILALLFPKERAFPPPIWTCRIKKIQTPIRRIIGNQLMRTLCQKGVSYSLFALITTCLSLRILIISGSSGA